MTSYFPCASWQILARYIAERQAADLTDYPIDPVAHKGHRNSAAKTRLLMANAMHSRQQSVFFDRYLGEVK